jgi:hypothetical protein
MTEFFDEGRAKIGHRPCWTATRDYVLPSIDLYPTKDSNCSKWELRIMVGGSTAIREIHISELTTLLPMYQRDPEGFVRSFMRREPPSERQASHQGSEPGKPRQGPTKPRTADIMPKTEQPLIADDLDLGDL